MAQERITVESTQPMLLCTYLRRYANVSARLLARLKQQEMGITRNGIQIKANDIVSNGDVLVLRLEESAAFAGNATLQVPVIYETDSVIVYNKPVEMPVHPSAKHRDDTLANCYAAQFPTLGFHAVFRLDRNTSGLCMIAKTPRAANQLQGQIQKKYYALVPPDFSGSGTVTAPIGRKEASVINRCVKADGREAVTHYRTIMQTPDCTLLELTPETGRTHQIRVHMAHIGAPLLGDDLYGGDCTLLAHQALHCGTLQFTDPDSRKVLTLQAPLRQEMQAVLARSNRSFDFREPVSDWYSSDVR